MFPLSIQNNMFPLRNMAFLSIGDFVNTLCAITEWIKKISHTTRVCSQSICERLFDWFGLQLWGSLVHSCLVGVGGGHDWENWGIMRGSLAVMIWKQSKAHLFNEENVWCRTDHRYCYKKLCCENGLDVEKHKSRLSVEILFENKNGVIKL